MPKEPRVSKLRPTPYGRPAPQPTGLWSRIKSFFSAAPPPAELGPPQLVSREPSLISENSELPSRLNAFKAKYEPSDASEFPSSLGANLERAEQSALLSNISNASTSTGTLTPNEALEQFFAEKGDSELSNLEVMGALSLIGQAVGRNESLIDLSNLGEISSHLTSSTTESTSSDRGSFDLSSALLRGVDAPSPRSYRQGTPPPALRRASSRTSLTNAKRSSSLRSQQSPWGSPHPYARPANAFSASMGIQTPRKPVFSSVNRASKPNVEVSSTDSVAVQAIKRAIAPSEPTSVPTDRRSRYIRSSMGTAKPESEAVATEPLVTSSVKLTESQNKAKPSPALVSPLPDMAPNKPVAKSTVPAEPAADSPAELPKNSATNSATRLSVEQAAKKPVSLTQDHTVKPFVFAPPKPIEVTPVSTTQAKPKAAEAAESNVLGNKLSEPNNSYVALAKTHPKPVSNPSSLSELEFEFAIPTSQIPRDLTPAEEAVVSQSQTEFRF